MNRIFVPPVPSSFCKKSVRQLKNQTQIDHGAKIKMVNLNLNLNFGQKGKSVFKCDLICSQLLAKQCSNRTAAVSSVFSHYMLTHALSLKCLLLIHI